MELRARAAPQGLLAAALLALLCVAAAGEEDWSTCVQPCKCKWLSGRKAADCSNTTLSTVPSGLSAQIQWLDVSNNRLSILPGDAFRSVGLVNLQKAYLRDCDIEELHKEALAGLLILIELDLSGNKIRTLHPGVFSQNLRLRILNLNKNPIQKVQDGVFSNLKFLQTVEMADCQVAHVAHKAFVNVPNLQTLRLSGNNLTNMKPDTLRHMDKLKSLELHRNPWNCDCHLKTFYEWMMDRNLYAQPTACHDPEALRGRHWNELEPDDLACKPEIVALLPGESARVDSGNATLSCRVQGNPSPAVHWVHKSRILSNHTRRNLQERAYLVRDEQALGASAGAGAGTTRWVNLTILEARFSDEGEYRCVARNRGGVAESRLQLEVVDSGARGGGGVLGASLGDAWPLILGLVVGMAVLLVIVVVLVCCYCRTKDPRTNNTAKKSLGEGVSSNGDLTYHAGPGSEQEKSLITVVNPVQKPPRRYETLSTSAPNEFEMKATLLDNGSVIIGPSVAESEDPLQDRSLESLETVPARSRETIDAECGRPGAQNLPPDLLSFPSRGSQVSPAGSSASTAPDSSRLPAQHGPQSPVCSPLYLTQPHIFGTLPYSRSQSPFTPAPVVITPRQGYVTIPRRPRVPSWSSPPPLPLLAAPTPATPTTAGDPTGDPLTANKLEPVYDNLGPRTTADGSSVLSLNKAGESPTPAAIRNRPLPPTPTLHNTLPAYYSPIAPIKEQPSPVVPRANLGKQMSNPNLNAAAESLLPEAATPTERASWARATPDGASSGLTDGDSSTVGKRASSVSSVSSTPPSSTRSSKVPPKPPPKPKKKTDSVTGPLYEDEGEDGTEV